MASPNFSEGVSNRCFDSLMYFFWETVWFLSQILLSCCFVDLVASCSSWIFPPLRVGVSSPRFLSFLVPMLSRFPLDSFAARLPFQLSPSNRMDRFHPVSFYLFPTHFFLERIQMVRWFHFFSIPPTQGPCHNRSHPPQAHPIANTNGSVSRHSYIRPSVNAFASENSHWDVEKQAVRSYEKSKEGKWERTSSLL